MSFDGDSHTFTATLPWKDHETRPNAACLTIIWSLSEPFRAGECMILPQATSILGRGGPREGDTGSRLQPQRWRPSYAGGLEGRPALADRGLSRRQLQLSALAASGQFKVENIGQRELFVDGRRCNQATVSQGSLIEIKNVLILRLEERPKMDLPWPKGISAPDFPFGQADPAGIVGETPEVWALRRALAFAGAEDRHTLIMGPSGTGKELAAQGLHRASTRSNKPLFSRSAATMPTELVDVELFGNKSNFPNPGMPEHPGLVGVANGSHLFLDEIGELNERSQAALLRVMDEGQYSRLGESQMRQADLRIIGATNRSSDELKHDLVQRFTSRLQLPGLESRLSDIPLIAVHILRNMAQNQGAASRLFEGDSSQVWPQITPQMYIELLQYPWHTHIRELESLLLKCLEHTTGQWLMWLPDLTPEEVPITKANSTGSFSSQHSAWLVVLRRNAFNPTACARDEHHPLSRQSATRQLRILAARAMVMSDFDLKRAVGLLEGQNENPNGIRLQSTLEKWLSQLHDKYGQITNGSRSSEQERANLKRYYGDGSDDVMRVIAWMNNSLGSFPSSPGP